MRRALVKRAKTEALGDSVEILDLLDAAVEYTKRLGLLNDEALARALITSYRRRGDSLRMIRQKLSRKGVSSAIADAVFSSETEDNELEAARRYAKKNRLGVYGAPGDFEVRQRALRRMARRGFTYGVSLAALEGDMSE